MSDNTSELTVQSKTISLFQFIRELNKLKQKNNILNTSDYPWIFSLSDLPDDPDNITLCYCDRVEDDFQSNDSAHSNMLLAVHKPDFQKCPEPNEIFANWLLPGWDDFHSELSIKEFIEILPNKNTDLEDETICQKEFFKDKEDRVKCYERWVLIRSEWANKQEITEQTRNLFSDLYRLYFELQRESETKEIIVANGTICDANNSDIHHPVLTHRVKIEYDADSNTVSIVDSDIPSELYSSVFQELDDVHLTGINQLIEDLQNNDYHPLDRNDTPDFLKQLVHQLSSNSLYSNTLPSTEEKKNIRLLLYWDPCLIFRNRLDGTLKAIDLIIEDIKKNNTIPQPIADIVSGGTINVPEDTGEVPIEERLAAVGGESIDILLSKEANKEQLDIAKRIENYNAVLVQGPPGTGKTHTIANLMGHLLAQGKSVLVTSYTKKALSVLKEKIDPGLQDLCVSMLDDSNTDMERSVNGITNYTAMTTSFEIKNAVDKLATERREVINELAEVRKKIYAIINRECNCIVINGEDISPSKAAAFVIEHADDLSYIPGKVRLNTPLPLSFEQLSALYRSNESLSAEDEQELATELPNPADIMVPNDFISTWNHLQMTLKKIKDIERSQSWTVNNNSVDKKLTIDGLFGQLSFMYPAQEIIDDLKQYALSFGKIDKWMTSVAVDGKNDTPHRQRWFTLIDEIDKTCKCSDEYLGQSLGKKLVVDDILPIDTIKTSFEAMHSVFTDKGKISKLAFKLHKTYEPSLTSVSINGNRPNSAEDCAIVLKYIELQQYRVRCGSIWNDLLVPSGVPDFFNLSDCEPERIAHNWVPQIQKYLNWYKTDYITLLDKLSAFGIQSDILFQKDLLDSEILATDKIIACIENIIPLICDIASSAIKAENYKSSINTQLSALTSGKRGNSSICKKLVSAIGSGNLSAYSEAYASLEKMYEKYKLRKLRNEALILLEPIAPDWAEAIRTREGIHGKCTLPDDIDHAWKWKQLNGIIEKIIEQPFAELQAESLRLSRKYRDITAKYAEKSGWYHLLKRTESDINMKHALVGWFLTVKAIGKGTGKKAPKLKAEARKLMKKCQRAVPGWIMPINKALESLDPRYNKFDVIIIDEASQSDISSLAILYMGKKLIIVGDDCQVSPMSIGINDEKISSLQEEYLNKIPNKHLYNAKTSIYDIAKTTFQPLMLREHFRCVPEIIGFSNMLSYDGKIRPLRDAGSSVLIPAIINYRVTDGCRIGKTNPKEARTIIALMQACFDQPEYTGKSFGVISLLGDEQVKLIQQEIECKLKPKDIIERSILCGNSANFQGDERDVIFLSLVDSKTGDGPIHKIEYGPDESYRKRYNVAASRARDQLWVVNSLDSANDLKDGDLRKKLIDYALDPKANEVRKNAIIAKSESPFEASVATALSSSGYHIEQQWAVGSYRLDIVAVCGKKKVAIECDGERWHSSEEKIREDMERQTILERLGWHFIRIRGSEFYSNREKTIERVISELTKQGIKPEDSIEEKNTRQETDLLHRIKMRAAEILQENNTGLSESDLTTISVALNPSALTPTVESQVPLTKTGVASNSIKYSFTTKDSVIKQANKPTTSTPFLPKETPAENHSKMERTAHLGSTEKTKNPIKTHGDDFVEELRIEKLEYIDNRVRSNIIWILDTTEKHELIKTLITKYKQNASFEKHGAIATNNQPAWRVMF